MPLDVNEPEAIKLRLSAYLEALGMGVDARRPLVERACEGAAYGGQAFARLHELMAQQAASLDGDEVSRAAAFRLRLWGRAAAETVAALLEMPAISRQSMASERDRS